MSFADDNPGYRLSSEEEARNWILEQVAALEQKRRDCDITFPGDETTTARWQIKAYRKYLVQHGSCLGSLMALHRTGVLSDVAYNELRERTMQTLMPTIVGLNDQRG